jgi:hypothetical protein
LAVSEETVGELDVCLDEPRALIQPERDLDALLVVPDRAGVDAQNLLDDGVGQHQLAALLGRP